MRKFVLKKEKIILLIFTIAFFLLFLNDHTIYSVFFDNYTSILTVIAALLFIIGIFLVGKIYSNVKFWISIVLWLICVTISCVLYGVNRMYYVRIVYWFVVIFSITSIYLCGIDFKKIFYNVAKIFLIWALVNYCINLYGIEKLPITDTASELLYKWYDVNLYQFFFSKCFSHLTIGGMSFLRLDRPFGEPGIAQMYFNFAILYILFCSNEKKSKKNFWLVLFSAGSLLSFSLTGYIIYLFLFLVYFYKKKRYSLVFIMSFISFIIVLLMFTAKTETFSYSDRSADLRLMLNTIMTNLPFGIGLGNANSIDRAMFNELGDLSVGFYCGLLYPLSEYGLFGLLYYFILLYSIFHFSREKEACVAFAIYILITLFTEPQADEPFIVAFLISGLVLYSEEKKYNFDIPKLTIGEE